jgi:hypothetical protein
MLTASTVSIYAGGQLKPPASTDTSPGGLLSQPPAHLSEYLRSERGLTQLLTYTHTHTHTHTHSLPTLAAATSSREPHRSRNRPCPPATAARELRPHVVASAAVGKLSTHSSTSSSSTDVEQVHRHRMASSSVAPNLRQFVPLPLLTCTACRLQFVWFRTKSNGVIYKCPNNHVVCFSYHSLIHLISTDSVDIILVIISWLLVDIILVGFVDYYWFGWYNISRICWLLLIRLI